MKPKPKLAKQTKLLWAIRREVDGLFQWGVSGPFGYDTKWDAESSWGPGCAVRVEVTVRQVR